MALVWLTFGLIVAVMSSCTASTHFKPPLKTYNRKILNMSYTLRDGGCLVNGILYQEHENFTLKDHAEAECVIFQCLKDRVTTNYMGCYDGKTCRTGLFTDGCNTYMCFVASSVNHSELQLTVIRTLDNLISHECLVHSSSKCVKLGEWFRVKDKLCRCSVYDLDECKDLPQVMMPGFMLDRH